jgi:hypothetical protein
MQPLKTKVSGIYTKDEMISIMGSTVATNPYILSILSWKTRCSLWNTALRDVVIEAEGTENTSCGTLMNCNQFN